MEKFTKFDDKRTGINPFLPPTVTKLNILLSLIRFIGLFPIFVLKLALLCVLYPIYLALHVVKYLVSLATTW